MMDYQIAQRVINVISETQHCLTGDVHVESTLEELGIDSFDGINLLYALEEEFNITLTNEARNLKSVAEIASGIALLLAKEDAEMVS